MQRVRVENLRASCVVCCQKCVTNTTEVQLNGSQENGEGVHVCAQVSCAGGVDGLNHMYRY